MTAEGEDAKRRRVEPAAGAGEEPKEPEVPPEQEQDARPERRTLLNQPVDVQLQDCTLNVIPTLGGRVLTPLTDGGLQYLVAGARANVGVRKGRYMFEVKIVEVLNPHEPPNSRSSRAPMPRQLVRVGFSTQDSSLFLGETEESVCFDSEGFFTADKKRSASSQRFGRDQTIAVLLNLDRKSPNADTVSLFRDGVRICQPQPLPEYLLEKTLFPHVNFKNVTMQVSFGPTPLAPLPFVCRTWQEVVKDDADLRKSGRSMADGKYEVLFPVGLPDEGTFDWLDRFLQKNPHYTEISDRTILRWAERSGLWRPHPNNWKNSNDKPEMNFGIPMMDDSSVRRVLNSVIATQPRNYIVMEVKSNLIKEERQELMKRFFAPCYKKVAMVVMGEPTDDFKAQEQENMLKEKQVVIEQERLRRKVERERKKVLEAQLKQAEEAKKRLEEAAAAEQKAAEEAKKDDMAVEKPVKEEAAEVKKEEGGDGEAKADAAAAVPAPGKDDPAQVKKEEDDEKAAKEEAKTAAKKEEESEDEPMPVAELTEEEKKRWFRKKAVPDLTTWVLSNTFTKFTMPETDEGFDEVRFAWQKEEGSRKYLKEYILKHKVLCRLEDVMPSDWFRNKWADWQRVLQEWHNKQQLWKETSARQAAEKAAQEAAKIAAAEAAEKERKEGEEPPPPEEAKVEEKEADDKAEVDDIMEVRDVCDVGKGEPLFSRFEFEDWALMSLRLELHLLVHAFRKDVSDPERIGIHEMHLPFYYSKYFRKSFDLKNYGVETNPTLVEMIKDTVVVNPTNMVLEPKLSADLEGFDTFAKLTEEARRERTRRLDAGDETVKLKFSKPEVPPQKGAMPPQQVGGGQQKGGKPYYTPRQSTPYGSGGKGGGYMWGSKSGGGYGPAGGAPAGGGGKGYGGSKGQQSGGYKGSSSYGKGYGK